MDPRTYAPWIRGGNTNTLMMGAMGPNHIPAVAFYMGMSPNPLQRAGVLPMSPLTPIPAEDLTTPLDWAPFAAPTNLNVPPTLLIATSVISGVS